jgi:hypothetical protein
MAEPVSKSINACVQTIGPQNHLNAQQTQIVAHDANEMAQLVGEHTEVERDHTGAESKRVNLPMSVRDAGAVIPPIAVERGLKDPNYAKTVDDMIGCVGTRQKLKQDDIEGLKKLYQGSLWVAKNGINF